MVLVSDSSLLKATGKTWKQWIAFLDKKGANSMSHTALAAFLLKEKIIASPWWCQMVTNGYEKAKGKRVLGSTTNGLFQVGAQKTFLLPLDKAWQFIISKKAVSVWLGNSAPFSFAKGEKYKTKKGIGGEVRIINPQENIRISWKNPAWKKSSILQIRTTAKGNNTVVGFYHDSLPTAIDREEMRIYWQGVLQKLEVLLQ